MYVSDPNWFIKIISVSKSGFTGSLSQFDGMPFSFTISYGHIGCLIAGTLRWTDPVTISCTIYRDAIRADFCDPKVKSFLTQYLFGELHARVIVPAIVHRVNIKIIQANALRANKALRLSIWK